MIGRYSGDGRAAHYLDLARQVVVRNPDPIIVFSAKLAGGDELGDTLGLGFVIDPRVRGERDACLDGTQSGGWS